MELLYGERIIARIEPKESDFPTFFGSYEWNEESSTSDLIKEYHDYSVETWPLIEEDKFEDIDSEMEEKVFGKLIHSEKWWIKKEDEMIPILIPVFCTNQEINWRIDPSR